MKKLFAVWLCVMLMFGSTLVFIEVSEDAEAFVPSETLEANANVLLVDADSYNDGLVNYYIWPLQNISANFTVWDVYGNNGPAQGKPIAADMAPFKVVIWIPDREMSWTGEPFDAVDEAEVATYLNGGGNFLISNIAYTDFTDGGTYSYTPGDFVYDYLGMSGVNGWSGNEFSVNGTVGDEVFDGVGPCIQDWTRGNWPGFPPWMSDEPYAADGIICFFNDDGFGWQGPAGIRCDGGTFRTMFFGFPLETLSSADANEIMNRTMTWFSSTPGIPQMTISKNAPATANPGETIMYTITYQNTGEGTAYVEITETYPSGVIFVDSNPPPTIWDDFWMIGEVPPGSGGTIYVNVSVELWVTGTITNRVDLDYVDIGGNPQPMETDSADTFIGDPFMVISKEAPATANPGELIIYWIFYNNTGTDWAYNLTITDTYPVGTSFMASSPSPDIGNNIWNISDLAPGASGSIQISVWVNMDVLIGTLLINSATIDYENGVGAAFQNGDTASTFIIGPLMSINKLAPAFVEPGGETITYIIDCNNFGSDWAYNLVVTEYYPPNVTFISAVPLPDIGNNTWLIDPISPGAGFQIQITVQVDPLASGSLVNYIELEYENAAGVPQPTLNDTAVTNILGGDSPIRINSNADFDPAHGVTGGNGTEAEPWIIENYDINGTGRGNCIYIGNTTEHFVVRNCYLHDASGFGIGTWPFYGDIALILYNAANGSVEHNVVTNNKYRGIYLYNNSCNNVVMFNTARNNTQSGLHISTHSNNNYLYSNNVTDNGIWGLILFSSNNNTIEANTVSNNGEQNIYLTGSDGNIINFNDCIGSSLNNGISLDHGSDHNTLTNNSCLNNQYQGISIHSSNYTQVFENYCVGNGNNGIYLTDTHDNTLSDNNCSGNIEYHGISLDGACYDNMISDNSLIGNHWYGIRLGSSNDNIIKNNDIFGNVVGVLINISFNNLIYHNNFLGNTALEAVNEGLNNWDNGYPSGGNYWIDYNGTDMFSGPGQNESGSDGIGDTPYVFIGDQDDYPLMEPWGKEEPQGIPIPWFDDMESGQGNWTVESYDNGTWWELGDPMGWGPGTAYSGNNCWGTNINASYNYGANAILTTPKLESPSYGILSFYMWFRSTSWDDAGWVEVSSDGWTWDLIEPVEGPSYYNSNWGRGYTGDYTGNTSGWQYAEFDLSSCPGGPLWIRFTFRSDWMWTYHGWYIDDVYVGLPPAYDVELLPDSQTGNGNQNDTISYSLTIHNKGSENDTYDLSSIGNMWDTRIYDSSGTVEISSIGLGAGNYVNITVKVTIPVNATGGASDLAMITATSQSDANVSDQATIDTFVNSVHNIDKDIWYPTIQQAVDNADQGNHLWARSGTYYENINIWTSNIILTGEDKNTTIIDGGSNGRVVSINSNGVTISDFTIRNSRTEWWDDAGIYLIDSDNCRIENNIIVGNYRGIFLRWNSDSNTVTHNIISNNGYGIYAYDSSSGNTIEYNTITSNDDYGVFLGWNADDNTVAHNTISNNGYGIYLENSNNNIIDDNTITSNNWRGIYIGWDSNGNMISNNLLSENKGGTTINVYEGNDNTITNNNITSNNGNGIYLSGNANSNNITHNNITLNSQWGIRISDSSNGNLIENNTISKNWGGIQLRWYANENSISHNNILSNSWCGVYIYETSNNTVTYNNILSNHDFGVLMELGCSDNKVHHNNIADHWANGYEWSINSTNTWDDGYPSGGNYWGDYIGNDFYSGPNQDIPGFDGFGDNPYDIIGGDNQDHYPFINTVPGTGPQVENDTAPPEHTNECPPPFGLTNDPTTTISVWLYDDTCVNESTIKLYVNGFSVKTNKSLMSDGYNVYFNVSYTHDSGFNDGEVVTCRIKANDIFGNPVDYTWQFTVDLMEPYVISNYPLGLAVDVSRSTIINVTFSEPMDKASAEAAFSISPFSSGTFSWSGNTLTYTLNSELAPATTYTIYINTSAKDLAGNNMTAPHSWQFTTEEAQVRIYHTPVTTAELGENITIECIVVTNGNSSVVNCTIYYIQVGGTNYTPISMILVSGDAINGTWRGDIPGQFIIGTLEYYLEAWDNTSAIATHPETDAITDPHEISIVDTTSPSHANEYPLNGSYISETQVTISVEVTDLSAINTNTIVLYVNGFSVDYILAVIPGGYNVSYWHEAGFSEGEVVTCRIIADDVYGNTLDFTWDFTVLHRFEISLSAGWNLISFPLVQGNTSILSVLSSIDGRWDLVQYYNASDTADHWKMYATFMPPSLNDLWMLDHTMGFWLHTTEVCNLTVYGLVPASTQITLFAGWNLVGYPSLAEKSISDALAGTGYDGVEGFNATAPYLLSPLDDSYMMKPGEGYWVHVPADTTWTIDW